MEHNDNKRKILVVEDSSLDASILRKLLADRYDLAIANNGEEGLQLLEQFHPGLALVDIHMPGIDGYETCRRLKASPAGTYTQVILISGSASTRERLHGYEVGADDYVLKPFDHAELLARIRVQFRMRDTLIELSATSARLASANAKVGDLNTELIDLAEERAAEVVATRDLVIFAMAKLAESRDRETGEHLERMRNFSHILAKQLAREGPYTNEIDEGFIEDLYRSSPLHDIGKVGIPDAILQKPGPLTDEEREVMKQHCTIGADALEEIARQNRSGGFLDMAAQIARHHHERFDGNGYPNGLAGQQIPLPARIVGLADMFDALISGRVYKPAYDPTLAKILIEKEEGKHFDPAIVDAFRKQFSKLLDAAGIEDKFTEPASQPVLQTAHGEPVADVEETDLLEQVEALLRQGVEQASREYRDPTPIDTPETKQTNLAGPA